MAKKSDSPNGADQGVSKSHNVKELTKLIRECATSMVEIKGERQELNERAGDIRKRLRESGVETKAFDFAVRLKEMEGEAQGNYIDWLKVSFEALGIGAQADMFPKAEAGATA